MSTKIRTILMTRMSKVCAQMSPALAVAAAAVISHSPLAEAAKFNLDKTHANIEFRVKHLMVSTVKGRFDKFDGSFDFDPKSGEVSNIQINIKPESINTNNEDRDKHLRDEDFFHVTQHKEMLFVGEKFKVQKDKPFTVKGKLTMRGVTKPITLTGKYNGLTQNPFTKKDKIGFELSGKINRKDWGLKWNKTIEAGGVVVSEEVELVIDAEADAV